MSKAIADAVNDSLIAYNIHGIVQDTVWNNLIADYFDDTTANDSDLDQSYDSEDDSQVRGNASKVSATLNEDQNDETEEDQLDCPVIATQEVQNIMNCTESTVNLVSKDDDTETKKIADFRCHCKYGPNNTPCYNLFTKDYIQSYRLDMFELDRYETDLIIIGQLAAHIQRTDMTMSSNRKSQSSRQLTRVTYYNDGHQICRDVFKFLHSISQNKLTALISWYREHGFKSRRCLSGGRIKALSLSFEDVTRVVSFITNYAEANAIMLPGRIPGYKRTDIKLLPSYETKASLWRIYHKIMTQEDVRGVKLSSFRQLWNELLPFIVVCKPMSDLCAKCQANNTRIYKSANISDSEKSDVLREQEEHLRIVKLERSLYQKHVADSKVVVATNELDLGSNRPCSRDIEVNYSFDFAQQVFYPNDPLQPGPIYFLVPRKCGIFGVCCEGIPKQVNFLIDEGSSVTKGSNSVISYVDYFFEHYGLGETCVNLHADNCSGQNKNRFMLWYLLWRTLIGLHRSIKLSFLISGHTKFAPDWCFGLVKQRYRVTPVSTLTDIANVVNSSTVSGANVAQLVGTEDGTQIVPTRDWQEFFAGYFKTFVGIKSCQHFRFDAEYPGVVFYQKYADTEEQSVQLLRNVERIPPSERHTPIVMPGLDYNRKLYLHDKIRPYVREDARDIVCPKPTESRKRARREEDDD